MGKKRTVVTPTNMATPAWAPASASTFKREVQAKNDPTGMRQAGLNLISAFNSGALQQAGLVPFAGQDPRSESYVAPGSNLYQETMQEANRELQSRGIGLGMLDPYSGGNQTKRLLPTKYKGTLEDYVKQYAPSAVDELQDYQNKFGQWKDQYTSKDLDAQIRAFEKGLPDLQFLGGQDSVANRINSNLMSYGISNLNQVGSRAAADGKTEFFNRATGQTLPGQVMHFKSNHQGTLRVGLGVDQNGNTVLRNDFEGPKQQFGDYMGQAILATIGGLAGGAIAPAISGAVGGATGLGTTASGIIGNGLAQGVVNGGIAAMDGQNAGKAFLTGAVAGSVGAGVDKLNPAGYLGVSNPILGSTINRGLGGALTGGAGAAINGGNVGEGALRGGLSGAASGLVSSSLKSLNAPDWFSNAAGNVAGKYAGSQIQSNPVAGKAHATASNPFAQGNPATVGPLSQMRQFNIGWLPEQRQQRIRSAYDTIKGYGATGLENTEFV